MGAAGSGSSLLLHVGLLGAGFVLGRVPLLAVASQVIGEIQALPTSRKVAMTGVFVALVAAYVFAVLLPMDRVARAEATEAAARRNKAPATSFRRELRRRGSYSMSYVMDIKAHVFGGASSKGRGSDV